jgi:putative transposase
MVRPALKRQAVAYIVSHYALAHRRACRILRQHRSVDRYRSRLDPRTALRSRMRELAQVRMRYGYRRLHVLLRREGWRIGRELTYRIYTQEGLQLRSKRPRRRKMAIARRERYVPKRPNQARSMDFAADQLVNGTRFRALTVVDVFTREALSIEVGQRLRGDDVIGVCNRLAAQRGSPVRIFVDNVLRTEASPFSGDRHPIRDVNDVAQLVRRTRSSDPAIFRVQEISADHNEHKVRHSSAAFNEPKTA